MEYWSVSCCHADAPQPEPMSINKIKTLVIDDEPAARRSIRLLLDHDPDIEVVGEAASGSAAVRLIRKERPDLVFLEVQMPEMDGFTVLASLGDCPAPAVVFVTAHDRHALQAFEVGAVDYLLKPFADERFWAAVRRAKTEIVRRQIDVIGHKLTDFVDYLKTGAPALAAPSPASPTVPADAPAAQAPETITRDRILLKAGGEIFFLKAEEIDWIEAEGDYMKFHARGRVHLLRETMGSLEDRLDPKRFIRIHRSTIVNIDRVKKLSPTFAGEYVVILHDGAKLRLSRGYHERLQELLRNTL